jgi:hypothetical protein
MPLEEQFLNHKSNIQQKVRVATGANVAVAAAVQARYTAQAVKVEDLLAKPWNKDYRWVAEDQS